jgi:uncharacterized delta-60 repeat protein
MFVCSRGSLLESVAFIALIAFAVLAHAQDGSYDTSFGAAGTGQTWIDVTPSTLDYGTKLIRLPNGNFFMGGGCGGVACAVWLTPSGRIATGYGTSGTGTASFGDFPGWPAGGSDVRDAVALADGRVAMIIDTQYLAVIRADGTGLDPSIGNGAGYTNAAFEAVMLRVTPQGQFIVVGATPTLTKQIAVARYGSDFRLDTSFGSSGTTTIAFDNYTFPGGMTLQRDGKIVVIASVEGSPNALGIVRLTADGAPDPNFGIQYDGKFKSTFGSANGAWGNDIVEDKQGRLVFAGYVRTDSSASAPGKWLVDRLLSGGATDPGFNGGNPQEFLIQTSPGVDSPNTYDPQALCVALQTDNRIVVAGTMDRDTSADTYFAIARFKEDGTFDSSFGGGGQSYGDMSPQAPNVVTDLPLSMIVVPGGIIVAGYTKVKSGEVRFSAAKERIDLLFADDFE